MTGPKLQCLLALHNLWHFYSFLNSTSAAVLLGLGFLQNLNVSLGPTLSQRALENLCTDFWDLHLYSLLLSEILLCSFQLPLQPLRFNFYLLRSVRLMFFTWASQPHATVKEVPTDIKQGWMWRLSHDVWTLQDSSPAWPIIHWLLIKKATT